MNERVPVTFQLDSFTYLTYVQYFFFQKNPNEKGQKTSCVLVHVQYLTRASQLGIRFMPYVCIYIQACRGFSKYSGLFFSFIFIFLLFLQKYICTCVLYKVSVRGYGYNTYIHNQNIPSYVCMYIIYIFSFFYYFPKKGFVTVIFYKLNIII